MLFKGSVSAKRQWRREDDIVGSSLLPREAGDRGDSY